MQLSKDTVDELNAKDGTPTRQLHEVSIGATRDRDKGDEERNPRIGHQHRLGGEMRGITQVSAGLCEGSGGGHNDGWRGRGVSGHGRGRDIPRQGVRVCACAIPLNTAHG
eukprot:6212013-Pleurochrysis_carterae.AAC.3